MKTVVENAVQVPTYTTDDEVLATTVQIEHGTGLTKTHTEGKKFRELDSLTRRIASNRIRKRFQI